VVALDFDDFARAVRRKLVLEIANRAPTGAAAGERAALNPAYPRRIARTGASALRLVQAKREEELFPPGCLVGERRVQQFMQQRGFNP
jgi:hypothetical protein